MLCYGCHCLHAAENNQRRSTIQRIIGCGCTVVNFAKIEHNIPWDFHKILKKRVRVQTVKKVTNGNSGDFAVDTYINGETQPNPTHSNGRDGKSMKQIILSIGSREKVIPQPLEIEALGLERRKNIV